MDISVGQRLGAYEIVAFLGSGAMGAVYRARDGRLGRDVALKILHEELAASSKVLKRFDREAQSTSALNHPNIVTIYEVGAVDGLHFIAMEYIAGERLRDLLRRETLTLPKIVKIASAMADGLAAAHAVGIVHRDLKPENVMISRDGFIKILDFGLAKPFRTESDPSEEDQTLQFPSNHTDHGAIVGTPSYMSPEQVAGEKVDHRSDQFSFGAILFEMITRRRPFDRATPVETMTAILRETPPNLNEIMSEVPSELDRIIRRCLAKSPKERFSSTGDLAFDLHALRDHPSIGSGRTPRPRPAVERPSRTMVAIALTLLIVTVVAGATLLFRGREDTPSANLPSVPGAASLPAQKYLAVLPFEDLTGKAGAELYAQGTSETISIRLASLPGIHVIPPSAGQGVTGDLAMVASKLGANLILRGSVRRADDNLRVNYMLMDPRTGVQMAAGTVNGTIHDPFLLEDRLADSILQALDLELNTPLRATNQGLLDAAEQDRYLQALGSLQRYENEASVDQALELLEQLHGRAPQSALVGAALGRAYLYKFQLTHDQSFADRAIEVSRDVIRLDPKLPEVHITYGEVLTRLGRYDDAILRFRQALSERPDSPQAMLGMAEALDRAGRDDEARSAYENAIAMRPLFWGGYNKLGVFHFRRGHLDEAAAQFRKVVEITPDNARALSNLGAIDFQLGRFEEAARRFRQSVDVNQTSSGWSNVGTALYYIGRFEEAAEAFERSVELTPESYLLWMNLGDACRWSDDRKAKAETAYRKTIDLGTSAVERDPTDARAHAILAVAHAKLGQPDRARPSAARAVALAPADADVLMLAAIVAHLGERDQEAIDLLSRSLSAGASVEVLRRDPELAKLRRSEAIQRILSEARIET